MEETNRVSMVKFEKGSLHTADRLVVREFPLHLTVNGRELATLICSPHQLNFLAAGFLRLQGFIESPQDLLSLGICAEAGIGQIRIGGNVPEGLRPTLTSGCGSGISYNLPTVETMTKTQSGSRYSPEDILNLMKELGRKTSMYKDHGGIHSAAVGRGEDLLLFAEDVGRHNTLDRIAGEALLRGIDLQGTLLVTSGRISTEMVAKAARLGIVVLASRTSVTDAAFQLAQQAGITLVGYLRGSSFEVYSHPERIVEDVARQGLESSLCRSRIPGITGVILAGGESRRMGSDKSLLPLSGARFIDHTYRCMAELFEEVIIVTNSPLLYQDIPCRKVPDIYFAQGALAGLHSGLCHARHERIFAVACDMPFLSPELVRFLCLQGEGDIVLPQSATGPEPLHALYHKNCLGAMEEVLDAGRRRIVSFFPQVAVRTVAPSEIASIDPEGLSFRNINTPEEYFALREVKKGTPAQAPERVPARRRG